MPALKPGDAAPSFRLKDQDGNEHSLDEAKGKSLVLWFYPEADTPGCTAEGCSFRDHLKEYEAKNAVILGVSFDAQEKNKKFHDKYQFTFPLLCDVERKMGVAYGAAEDPTARSARRIGVVIGPDGLVKHYFPKVDAKTFPTEALKLI